MAKARNGRSVDEDEVEEVPPSEAEKSGDEEGEEYEIETILDAKQGTFEGVSTPRTLFMLRTAYLDVS